MKYTYKIFRLSYSRLFDINIQTSIPKHIHVKPLYHVRILYQRVKFFPHKSMVKFLIIFRLLIWISEIFSALIV